MTPGSDYPWECNFPPESRVDLHCRVVFQGYPTVGSRQLMSGSCNWIRILRKKKPKKCIRRRIGVDKRLEYSKVIMKGINLRVDLLQEQK